MAQTLWVENEKQFSGGTDVGAKISKRKLYIYYINYILY